MSGAINEMATACLLESDLESKLLEATAAQEETVLADQALAAGALAAATRRHTRPRAANQFKAQNMQWGDRALQTTGASRGRSAGRAS